MALKTFPGGVKPGHFKHTKDSKIQDLSFPRKVYIPMRQHIGAPCSPVVEVGDHVKRGQKIGNTESFVSAPIYASTSGEVVDIAEYNHPVHTKAQTVVIEADGEDKAEYPDLSPNSDLDKLNADDIKSVVKEAGIVGMGGATFPTHVKISPPDDKPIDHVIINAAECEPYLTIDNRLMLEQGDQIVYGLKAIMKAVNCETGIIATEDNKTDAIEKMKELVKDDPNIQVMAFETKYPQGAEKQLINVVTGREVPSGGLPMDVGCIVSNSGTAMAVAEAIKENRPSYSRGVTVTGPGVSEPGNYMIRTGTLASDLIDMCGGQRDNVKKIIMGGPMTGMSQPNPDFPVIKGTSGILMLTEREVKIYEQKPCINCGRCVDSCPIALLPNVLGNLMEQEMVDEAEDYNPMDCIECGSCSYICPARRPLVHYIRVAKGEITAKKQNKK